MPQRSPTDAVAQGVGLGSERWFASQRSGHEVRPMPKKEHLPSVSDKEQKMHEHIKRSERESGRFLERSNAIAAATVVKHHNRKKHSSGR
jgi:hypothetical protein